MPYLMQVMLIIFFAILLKNATKLSKRLKDALRFFSVKKCHIVCIKQEKIRLSFSKKPNMPPFIRTFLVGLNNIGGIFEQDLVLSHTDAFSSSGHVFLTS